MLVLEEEENLFNEISKSETRLKPLWSSGDYFAVLQHLASLDERVNAFFDQVMVMDEDLQIRVNRLKLLRRLKALFDRVADFALIG